MALRPRALPVATAGLVLLAAGAALAGPSIPTLEATQTPIPSERFAATYKTFDGRTGAVKGTAKWHWTPTGGNCCEVYVTATAKGSLLEYGGSLPYLTPDRGRTWQQVAFPTPAHQR